MKRYIRAAVKSPYGDDYKVRQSLAETTSHTDVLQALAFDSDYGVRMAVACNPATPAETLALLAADPNYYVRAEVVDNLRAATPEIMAALLEHSEDNYYIRHIIANCPASGPDTLRFFVDEGVFSEKLAVINNPSTSYELLLDLAEDHDAQVRFEAKQKLDAYRKQR